MVVNGLHLLAVIVAMVLVFGAAYYMEWRSRDRIRRLDRLSKRGLA